MRDGVVPGRLGLTGLRLLRLGTGRRPVGSAFERRFLRRDRRGGVNRAVAGGIAGLPLRDGFARRLLALVLVPYLVEFHLDHARRHRELVFLGQLVEQRALEALARDRIVIALHALADLLAQLGEVLQPDRLGQRIVDRRRLPLAHFLDLDLEDRVLAGQIGRTVIGRERHLDGTILAGFGADDLVLETRDEAAGAELDRDILALAAGKFDLAGPADEIDHDRIAVCCRALDRLGFALRLGHALQRAVDLLVRHLDRQLFEAEIAKLRLRHIRQHFQRHRVFEVGAFRRRHDLYLRRQCRAQVLLANGLGRAALQRALQHLAAHRMAIALAQQVQRHLAWAEAGDADRAAELAEPAADLLLQLARRDGDLQFALQPLGTGLGHVHRGMLIRRVSTRRAGAGGGI